MKPILPLLAASLLANVAFVAVAVTRSPSPPARAEPSARTATAPAPDPLRAALAAGDTTALEAAGVPNQVVRELMLGRRLARIADQARAAQAPSAHDAKWWRTRGGPRDSQLAARRELGATLGLDLGGGDAAQLSFLPAAKRDQLRKILEDYEDLFTQFSASGIQLPSDRERLRLLRAERERDIAALLSPEEKLAYDLRTSPSAAAVRSRYGDAIETEAEFQSIYALQKAFDEKFPREAFTGRISPDQLAARAAAERQLDADLRAAVGDDRYAALRRAADTDARNLDGLASRLQLPAATTDTVLALRESLATESQRINADTSVSFPERRSQIQALGAQAKNEVTRALGAEAGAAYAQSSPWISQLSSGMAYSTKPTASTPVTFALGGQQSVYPVLPAGVTTGSAQRQVIVNGTPVSDFGIPVERPAGGTVQVMTFSTTEHTTTSPAAGSSTAANPAATAPAQPAPKP